MADDVIFMKQGDRLVELVAAPYDAEKVLQYLLEQHPQLLAGAQMNRTDPRRFLLIRREVPVPDHLGGGGRWSLDHLFLDHESIPTLVEVKRSTNTEIRRLIVGQILDYAANGPRYWPDLEVMFAQTPTKADKADLLAELLDDDSDVPAFWAQAERNLRGGPLRLLFVADRIPDELRAVIEFLNSRMPDTEVYGVEVARYTDGVNECFVPRLIGDSVSAATDKPASQSLDDLFAKAGSEVGRLRELLAAWASECGLEVRLGPKNEQVRDAHGAIVRLYPTFKSLDFPLEILQNAGHEADVGRIRTQLEILAGKQLTEKEPNLSCVKALEHWDAVVTLLDDLRRTRQLTDSPGAPEPKLV